MFFCSPHLTDFFDLIVGLILAFTRNFVGVLFYNLLYLLFTSLVHVCYTSTNISYVLTY